jgi:hypothetical protein
MTLKEAKRRLDIPRIWEYLGLPGSPGPSCHAPHRTDKNPSFSVYDGGQRFNDFATGERGDAIDFLRLVKNLSNADACRQFLGLADGAMISRTPIRRHIEKATNSLVREADVRTYLREGSGLELDKLAELRCIGEKGLRLAEHRGFLLFGGKKKVGPFWSLADLEGCFRQDRMLSGEPMRLRDGKLEKARSLGRLVRPLGQQLVADYPCVLLVEGGPDFLAAHYLIQQTADRSSYTVVGILGASQSVSDENWAEYKGKIVRIYPHMDEAGIAAATCWESKLKEHGAKVDVFDFAGLETDEGKQVNDLNDFLQVSMDFWMEGQDVTFPLPIYINTGETIV